MRGRGALVRGAAGGVLLLAAGCADGSDDVRTDPTPTSTRSTPSDAEVCTNQVRYWSRTLLTEGAYQGGDYQHMGLSDAQNEVLRALMAEATPLAAAQGLDAAVAFAADEAAPRCEAAYAGGGPTNVWG